MNICRLIGLEVKHMLATYSEFVGLLFLCEIFSSIANSYKIFLTMVEYVFFCLRFNKGLCYKESLKASFLM